MTIGLPRKWTTKSGEKIWINQMSTSHIENCIAMLERMAKRKKDAVDFSYLRDPGFSEDSMAMYCFEEEADRAFERTWEYYLPEVYYALQLEIEKRIQRMGE